MIETASATNGRTTFDTTGLHDREDRRAGGTVFARGARRRRHLPEWPSRAGPYDRPTHRGDVTAQTEQIFKKLEAVLGAAGKTFADVIKASVFLTNLRDFPAMNAVYERHFEAPYPARSTVGAAALSLGAAVENMITQDLPPIRSGRHLQSWQVHHGP